MPYFLISDFKYGMDRRRERVAGVPGTMWLGENVHITRGGDIERRKKFVPVYHVSGTFGVFGYRGQTFVFGSVAANTLTLPVGVQYQRLQHPSTGAMTKLLDVLTFGGKIYAIAEYDDGNVYHYYDGARVTDWDTIAAANADYTTLADLFAYKLGLDPAISAVSSGSNVILTAIVPGTAFTLSTGTTNGGGVNDQTAVATTVQPNVVGVAETRAKATFTITGGSHAAGVNSVVSVNVNGTELLTKAIDWTDTNESTALLIAQQINSAFQVTGGYTANAVGNVVTVTAPIGSGASANSRPLLVTQTGNISLLFDSALGGGVTEADAVAQIVQVAFGGTFEVADSFTITVNGTAYKATGRASGTGRTLYVDQNRVWSPTASLWRYCKLNTATVWDPAAGGSDAGFINVATWTDGNERLVAAGRYQTLAAIFSSEDVAIYQLDPNPANNALSTQLERTGTRAGGSLVRYGNNDLFYLDITGVRSLRARDASNAPFVSDVGTAIDTYVQGLMATLDKSAINDAKGTIESFDGRYLLSIGDRILVLSQFASAQISAWSVYTTPEFGGASVQGFAKVNDITVVRAGDDVYFYGGLQGNTLPGDDEVVADVQLPFMTASAPATIKFLTGFDIALTNQWECVVACEPNDDSRTINCGILSRITFSDESRIPLPSEASMLAPRFTCSKGGKATISMVAIHYESEDDPG